MLQSLLSLDRSLFLSIQSLIAQEYAIIFQILGEAIVIAASVFLVILWLMGVKHQDNEYKKISMRIFITIIGTFVLYSIINLGLPQWRPGAMELSGATALIPHPTDNSFPSGHALFSAALIIGIWQYYKKSWTITIFVLLGLVTAASRVAGGVHYPGDILGGFIFGTIGAIILVRYVITSELFERGVYPFFIRIAEWIKL